jgi:hypothetical protein
MIKAVTVSSAHTIKVFLRNILIFFAVLFLALLVWLKTGIEVDVLKLGKYKVERLYLKLGKKLTLNAQKIVIPENKNKTSFKNIEKSFDYAKLLFTIFHSVDLKNVYFNDNRVSIHYSHNTLNVSNDEYEISAQIERKEKTFLVDISMLRFKNEDVTAKGQLIYNLTNDVFASEGEFSGHGLDGNFTLIKEGKGIAFKVSTDTFSNLRPIIERTKLSANIQGWIVDRVQANHYTLNELSGMGVLEDEGFELNTDSLKANMLFENVKIHYHKKLDPILAENFLLKYENNRLSFDLKKPIYLDRNMSGSKLAICGLGSEKTVLELDLYMQTEIDDTLHKILDAYEVPFPVKHSGDAVNVHYIMDIPLNYKVEKNESKLLVDVDLSKGALSIGKSIFPVLSGKVHYDRGIITLKKVHIKEQWYEGVVNGDVDIMEKKAALILDAKEISLGNKDDFFKLNDKSLPVTLDFTDTLKINIPSLSLNMRNRKKDFIVKVKDINKLKPYIKNTQILDLNSGSFVVSTSDFSKYYFEGKVKKSDCIFYNEEICYIDIPLHGSVSPKKIEMYAFGTKVHFATDKEQVELKDINIDLKKLLAPSTKKRTNAKNKKKETLVILGKNSKLRYEKYALYTDEYSIKIKPNGDVKASGTLDGDIVNFSKKGKNISLEALRVKDKLLHPLIDFKGLQGGRYSLETYGNPKDMMYGTILIEGGSIREFQGYNNTMAIINVLPAITTLSNPGFSEKGFSVREGVIEYRLKNDMLYFDSIYIKGTSSSIVGKGKINLKLKTLDLKLAVQTARELGKIVGSIPVVGNILFGKEKSLTIGLTVKGDISKPTVETSVAKDILSLPLNIIKRTFDPSADKQ